MKEISLPLSEQEEDLLRKKDPDALDRVRAEIRSDLKSRALATLTRDDLSALKIIPSLQAATRKLLEGLEEIRLTFDGEEKKFHGQAKTELKNFSPEDEMRIISIANSLHRLAALIHQIGEEQVKAYFAEKRSISRRQPRKESLENLQTLERALLDLEAELSTDFQTVLGEKNYTPPQDQFHTLQDITGYEAQELKILLEIKGMFWKPRVRRSLRIAGLAATLLSIGINLAVRIADRLGEKKEPEHMSAKPLEGETKEKMKIVQDELNRLSTRLSRLERINNRSLLGSSPNDPLKYPFLVSVFVTNPWFPLGFPRYFSGGGIPKDLPDEVIHHEFKECGEAFQELQREENLHHCAEFFHEPTRGISGCVIDDPRTSRSLVFCRYEKNPVASNVKSTFVLRLNNRRRIMMVDHSLHGLIPLISTSKKIWFFNGKEFEEVSSSFFDGDLNPSGNQKFETLVAHVVEKYDQTYPEKMDAMNLFDPTEAWSTLLPPGGDFAYSRRYNLYANGNLSQAFVDEEDPYNEHPYLLRRVDGGAVLQRIGENPRTNTAYLLHPIALEIPGKEGISLGRFQRRMQKWQKGCHLVFPGSHNEWESRWAPIPGGGFVGSGRYVTREDPHFVSYRQMYFYSEGREEKVYLRFELSKGGWFSGILTNENGKVFFYFFDGTAMQKISVALELNPYRNPEGSPVDFSLLFGSFFQEEKNVMPVIVQAVETALERKNPADLATEALRFAKYHRNHVFALEQPVFEIRPLESAKEPVSKALSQEEWEQWQSHAPARLKPFFQDHRIPLRKEVYRSFKIACNTSTHEERVLALKVLHLELESDSASDFERMLLDFVFSLLLRVKITGQHFPELFTPVD